MTAKCDDLFADVNTWLTTLVLSVVTLATLFIVNPAATQCKQ